MKQYFDLTSLDGKDGEMYTCVFKEEDTDEALTLRKRYGKFACARCGRVDAGMALAKSGLPPDFSAIKTKRDFFHTCDQMGIVSSRLRRLFEAACDDVLYYDIQGKGDHFVIWPKHLVIPNGSKSFARTHKCGTCGHYRSIVFGPDLIRTFPDVGVGAVLLETSMGPNPAWFVDQPIAKQIKADKIKGVFLGKWIMP
jgi:hypothetical protein